MIGTGFVKITYISTLVNVESKQIEPIVRQKLKKKDCHPIVATMAKREANLQKSLAHPNIVVIYACNAYGTEENPKFAIYAEKCDSDLEKAIQNGSLSFFEKKTVMIDIADALEFIHAKKYSHNDVKPDNILIKNKRGKLGDFGLCYHDKEQSLFKGFKKIQPPEQKILTHQKQSQKTDVYQYGLVLWHVFHPAPDATHLDKDYVYPNDLFANWPCQSNADQTLQKLILACLSEDPGKRPTMQQVKTILNQI